MSSGCGNQSSSNSNNENTVATTKNNSRSCKQQQHTKKQPLYSFTQARRMARAHGFASRQEFLDYDCPGAYQLPKDPHNVWPTEWKGWDDFLGIPLTFEQGRSVARALAQEWNWTTSEDYLRVMQRRGGDSAAEGSALQDNGDSGDNDKLCIITDDDWAMRLPYRPDLFYQKDEWISWDDWLGKC